MERYIRFFLVLIFPFTFLDATFCCLDILSGPHRIAIGPEIYHIKRKRDGGINQTGWMYGERTSYNRIRPWAIYYGVHQYYAKGCVEGHTPYGDLRRSKLSDTEVEGRLGYTFSLKQCFLFTPFLGYGYFAGTNKFQKPCPLELTFRPRFQYAVAGFYTALDIRSCFRVGFWGKVKYTTNGKNTVEDDPDFDSIVQTMGDCTLYEASIPLTYRYWNTCEEAFEITLEPFYRTRCYGKHENFPFDFFETRFTMWGGRLMLTYVF